MDSYEMSDVEGEFSDCCNAPTYRKAIVKHRGMSIKDPNTGRITMDQQKNGKAWLEKIDEVHFCSKCIKRCSFHIETRKMPVLSTKKPVDNSGALFDEAEFAPKPKGRRSSSRSQHD